MARNIRKAVKEFKEENGNDNFSTKDLLMYIVHRVDNLPCEPHVARITGVESTLKSMKWAIGLLLTVILSLLIFSIGLHIS